MRSTRLGFAAVAMLGAALTSGIVAAPSDRSEPTARGLTEASPQMAKVQVDAKQTAAMQATRREAERERQLQRWRGSRYRKDGKPRKPGDRAHKRLKNSKRSGR